MKGPTSILAIAMKPKGGMPMGKPGSSSEEQSEGEGPGAGSPAEESSEGEGGSEMEFAKLASEATADGDHEAAAKALVSMVKACVAKYGGEE